MSDSEFFPLLNEVSRFPKAGNADWLRIGNENWSDTLLVNPEYGKFAEAFPAHPKGRRLLDALFGNSPYLSHCLLSDPAFFKTLAETGTDAALAFIYAELDAAITPDSDTAQIMRLLRIAKQRIALITAVADITGIWPLGTITRTLSDFAAKAVDISAAHLLLQAHRKGDIVLPHPDDPTRDSGLIILGMGKLGAYELNYSSDIDLIVLFDSRKVTYTGRKFMDDCFIRLTRDLVKIMQERTANGYVFRTDLRLRPDPGATPIALPLGAARAYYESQGQNWERAAMIKARPIAGDIEAGLEFKEFLRPFVWRKFLDFAAIADIQSIKSQIHAHKGFGKISLEGHNIKIGRGGIREIEFFCQTQQLIEGGRNPTLRNPSTLQTLSDLVEAQKVKPEVRDDLVKAYEYLRTLEHRLQMIHDNQTQLLPEAAEDFAQLGVFMGHADPEAFRLELKLTLETVQAHYDALFAFEEEPDRKAGRLVFTGAENDPETLKSLENLGYTNVDNISQIVRQWHHGRYRATRTERAQQLLTALMPTLLERLGDTADPDAAFMRFDAFLKKLPAGIQLFSLFTAHPSLLKLLAKIMGMAPGLANRLANNPRLLDGVLSPDFMGPLRDRDELVADLDLMLGTARDFQDVLEISRRWVNDIKFRIGVQILHNIDHGTGLGGTVAAGPALTMLAEVTLSRILPAVVADLGEKHGTVPGGEFAILGAGKLGSREMTPGSDMDLIFLFRTPEQDMMSDGPKPIPAGLYYTRLSQRVINALSALTGEGYLYEVDMRLRPHGKAGPIAMTPDAFQKYYEEEAWTWEHMALTRARPVAGDLSLQQEAERMIRHILTLPRDGETIAANLYDMRDRLQKQHADKSFWAIKHHRGGIMDLDFIVQYLKLIHGKDHPEILDTNTHASLMAMKAAGIVPADSLDQLYQSMRFYINLQGLTRLSLSKGVIADTAPDAFKEVLAEAGEVENFEALTIRLQEVQALVDRVFSQLVPKPQTDLPD
ncbi:bifunctional [glutamine synthetase] adenylyltransferase/[glutamine synthetase]-adenylyl-L-tyrosine phosphorylase [Sneathiella chinensis]|uniref:Bifunctional glutamine synthetase adenylyltransferase/adenylyl-removing enzyme n=1 Tax=Sneathiella chinensis TaxID=349750 RepID=A0ABQ5U8N8_9PROT|nr:bifunctional [glutamine synthetase] adenylyltransferase/[glutamine synthetase]-adenylyl-L-tyrosine phosphorylase [Sneathiella chinensis]GLQ07555.1 glutamate-ammonia-ligase adenylyltransferase [Sneathiella chinensis]